MKKIILQMCNHISSGQKDLKSLWNLLLMSLRALKREQGSALCLALCTHRSNLTASTESRLVWISEWQAILDGNKTLPWTLHTYHSLQFDIMIQDIFKSTYIIWRVEICENMPLLVSKILTVLITAWSLWNGFTCTDGRGFYRGCYLFAASNWKWPLWTYETKLCFLCSSYWFPVSLEENEWKAFHAQVRRNGKKWVRSEERGE